MKKKEQLYKDIRNSFSVLTDIDVQEGTVIDFYTLAVADNMEEAYTEIDNNRNPHIFTRLKGKDLDDTGWLFNMPRRSNEDDSTYVYRLMNWVASKEKSNETAIHDALLNLEHSSNAYFVPKTQGCGTATIYIIPNRYSNHNKNLSLEEAKDRIKNVISPTTHVEFIVPEPLYVKLHIYMDVKRADAEIIKENIKSEISEYISSIAPGDFLRLGDINRIGVEKPNVAFFNTAQLLIEDIVISKIEVEQEIHTKLFLQEIIWSMEG